MFGLLEPDALYSDGQYEWTYGVEPYSEAKDDLTRVYKLIIMSDVIVDVQETEYYVRVERMDK